LNKVAIAFTTKDRVELSRRSIEPLLQPDKFDLWWMDGSDTQAGQELPFAYWNPNSSDITVLSNVRGGADAAIVFSLSQLLAASDNYTHVGLVENDVLLHPDWFGPTMALFERGRSEGLEVGAVSARAYEDRILLQRDGYAVMHNLGAGMVIFTRRAAEIVLQHFRTGFTIENRRLFAQLTGKDIGTWWAFRGSMHMLTADWQFDRVLAAFGLASLALVPSPVAMIGQDPPLADQGLKIAAEPFGLLRDRDAFDLFVERTALIRSDHLDAGPNLLMCSDDGTVMVFAHQLGLLGGQYSGDWRLRWLQGFGPFAWECEGDASMSAWVSGPCSIMASGGREGGKALVKDWASGYEMEADLMREEIQPGVELVVPAGVSHRLVSFGTSSPGVIFRGMQVRESQLWHSRFEFNHSVLPVRGTGDTH